MYSNAVLSSAFGEIIRLILLNWQDLTGGPNGISGIPRPCRALGVNTTTTKLTAFALGAMFGGFAGAFFATRQVAFGESALVLAIVVLGGMGSQLGVAVAATVMLGGFELFREFAQYRMLVFGTAMVAIVIYRPRGLVSTRTPSVFLTERHSASRTRSLAATGNPRAAELIEKADELDKLIDAPLGDTEQVLGAPGAEAVVRGHGRAAEGGGPQCHQRRIRKPRVIVPGTPSPPASAPAGGRYGDRPHRRRQPLAQAAQ